MKHESLNFIQLFDKTEVSLVYVDFKILLNEYTFIAHYSNVEDNMKTAINYTFNWQPYRYLAISS